MLRKGKWTDWIVSKIAYMWFKADEVIQVDTQMGWYDVKAGDAFHTICFFGGLQRRTGSNLHARLQE